jgi:hypothetical protein
LRPQIATSSWGGRRYLPRAFTEQGVAMLSSVLRSKRAVQVNVAIVRTFVSLRRLLQTNEELARKMAEHDQEIAVLFEHVRTLLEPSEPPGKPRIGFAPARQGPWVGVGRVVAVFDPGRSSRTRPGILPDEAANATGIMGSVPQRQSPSATCTHSRSTRFGVWCPLVSIEGVHE